MKLQSTTIAEKDWIRASNLELQTAGHGPFQVCWWSSIAPSPVLGDHEPFSRKGALYNTPPFFPWSSFAFLDSLFSLREITLLFWVFPPPLCSDLRGSAERKDPCFFCVVFEERNPCFFVWFSLIFYKEKKIRVLLREEFWAPPIWIRYTYPAPFSAISRIADTNTHTWNSFLVNEFEFNANT